MSRLDIVDFIEDFNSQLMQLTDFKIVKFKKLFPLLCHPRQPLTGDLKMHFPFWLENFHLSYKFEIEVSPCVPTFGSNLEYTTAIIDIF